MDLKEGEMDEIKEIKEIEEIEEIKERYEHYKSCPFAYPNFYRAWQDISILLSKIKELEERV